MAEAESSELNETKEEESLTLVDFLEAENEIELTAQYVLGPSDDKNCTYNLGYVGRQALYACLTCNPPEDQDFKSAGICLACSYHCHEGHNLIELYTKRFFRCDCGNNHFKGKKCNLTPEKDEVNEKNTYNQNFKGVYCTCARPYPDPELDENTEDEMIQCIICEDWYHSSHLNNDISIECHEGSYAELICETCTNKLPFLNYYLDKAINIKYEGKEGNSEKKEEPKTETENTKEEAAVDVENNSQENKDCYRKTHPLMKRTSRGATFWPSAFRSLLCTCPECVEVYKQHNVPWISDEQDTVNAYQEKAGQNAEGAPIENSYTKGMKALQEMDRFRQVEAIQNYNDLKSQLHSYLAKFVQRKRVVKEEDIHAFFEYMQERKRQRTGTPPYMC